MLDLERPFYVFKFKGLEWENQKAEKLSNGCGKH